MFFIIIMLKPTVHMYYVVNTVARNSDPWNVLRIRKGGVKNDFIKAKLLNL